jgi:hypothetical protein
MLCRSKALESRPRLERHEVRAHLDVPDIFDEREGSQELRTCESGGAWFNGMRARGVERYRCWQSRRSSEGQKPMDGSGLKQSHEAMVG